MDGIEKEVLVGEVIKVGIEGETYAGGVVVEAV